MRFIMCLSADLRFSVGTWMAKISDCEDGDAVLWFRNQGPVVGASW